MKTLRDYINLVTEAPVQAASGGAVVDASGNPVQSGTPAPDANAAAAAKAKLTPSQLKWLGGADPTDPAIMARMPKPKPGEQVPGAAAPAAGAAAGGAAAANAFANKTRLPAGQQPPAQSGMPAAAAPSGPPPGSVDDEGNLMPGFTTDENGNVVSAGDPNFVEPATQKLAQQGRQDAKEKEMAAAADQADADMGAAMTANAQAAKEKEYAANADAEDQAMGQAMAANAAGGPSSVNAQGQNVTMPNGINPETGQPTQTAAAPAAPAQSGAPANRDSMTFSQAFADAKAKGEKQFTWKGKPYAVTLAAPKQANAGGGRGGQGGPTAAQMAQANAAKPAPVQAGKPAQPPGMGKPGPTVAAAQGADKANPLNRAPKKESRDVSDAKFIEELNLMRTIAGLR